MKVRGSQLLVAELSHNRPLAGEWTHYSAETAKELAIVRAAAKAQADFGDAAITTYNISKTTSVSDMLEVYVMLKQAGLYRIDDDGQPRARPSCPCPCLKPSPTFRPRPKPCAPFSKFP
jgi:phosphoenolpyruvate carboxylase